MARLTRLYTSANVSNLIDLGMNQGRAVAVILALLLFIPVFAHAQGGSISGQVVQPAPPTGTGGPAPFATIRVCPYVGGSGTPCSPLQPLFSDPGLTQSTSGVSDQWGNFSLWVAPGPYIVQVTPIAGTTYSYLLMAVGGTVSSVTIQIPSAIFNASGCTITSIGTCVISLAQQSPGTVFANCTSANGVPTFCALTTAMMPGALNPTCIAGIPVNARTCYGAQANLVSTSGCSMSATNAGLACTGAAFTSADVGKIMYVQGAGTGGNSLSSTIAAWVSANSVTLSNPAVTAVAGSLAYYGTDDTTALQNAYNAAIATGQALYIPAGDYLHHGLNWTGSPIKIYGDAYPASQLFAIAVTNPGRVNTTWTVGVDMSASSYNQVSNLVIWGGALGLNDLAPQINFLGGRTGPTGNAIAIGHVFETDFFITEGEYNVALFGYEQSDFHDCHFESDGPPTNGNLYMSQNNSPGFTSPYVTLYSGETSMGKVNVSGARTVFSGVGNAVVLDDSALAEGMYNISIRDAYANLGNGPSTFLADTGTSTSALRHIVLDTINVEMAGGCTTCQMVNVTSQAWDWRIENVQFYGPVFSNPIYQFANGFLDGMVLVDSSGSSGGEFSASSCRGSDLHLGQEYPVANCTDYDYLASTTGYIPGIASNGSITQVYPFAGYESINWIKLGTWVGANAGDVLRISVDSSRGYNTGSNQQGFAEITAAIANDTTAPNLSGNTAYVWAFSSPILALEFAATGGSTSMANRSWDVWIEQPAFTIGNYRVYVDPGATWTNINVTGSQPTGPTVVTGGVVQLADPYGGLYGTSLTIGSGSGGAIAGLASITYVPQLFSALTSCTAANAGQFAVVKDSTTETYNATISGSGTYVIPGFCNGTAWVAH